jgi:hypothetical protein
MEKFKSKSSSDEAVKRAAVLLGKRSWRARLRRYGIKELKEKLSRAGKKATGRPRMANDKVKPNTLYQRARREQLRARPNEKERS